MILKHKFHPTILREYDIRGIVDEDLSELDAFMLGYFFGLTVRKKIHLFKSPKIIVSRDGRNSSENLIKNLIKGLLKSGSKIINIGLNPTPTLYFANEYFGADGSIQVTGSHNPKNYNGFKMIALNNSFYGKDIIKLGEFSANGSDQKFDGKYEEIDVQQIYISKILEPIKNDKSKILSKKKVIWDCGNGATGKVLKKLINNIPGEHHILFDKIDGNFPNHPPDPTNKENLKELKNHIDKLNADLGIAFDGDGDRIAVMRKNGELIPGDLLTAFLSLSIKDKTKSIILDVKSSIVAKKAIENLGFNVEIWKTGHSNIKSRMKQQSSLLAGEMSGHVFFSDNYYGYDDALYSSIRFLQLMNAGKEIETFLNNLDEFYFTPEIKISCPEKIKFRIVEKIISKLKKMYDLKQLLLIDGVRVNFDFGWYLIRASNTENALVIRIEGKTNEYLSSLITKVKTLLKEESIFLNL
mgnify:CR=1 FL=1